MTHEGMWFQWDSRTGWAVESQCSLYQARFTSCASRPLTAEGDLLWISFPHRPELATGAEILDSSPSHAACGSREHAQALPGPQGSLCQGWTGKAGVGALGSPLPQHSFSWGSSFISRVSYGASFTTKSPKRTGGNCVETGCGVWDLGPNPRPTTEPRPLFCKMG